MTQKVRLNRKNERSTRSVNNKTNQLRRWHLTIDSSHYYLNPWRKLKSLKRRYKYQHNLILLLKSALASF